MKTNQLKLIILISLVVTMLFLSSCSGAFSNFSNFRPNPATTDFYKGSQGVEMRYSDMSSPPSNMYFYENNPDNQFNNGNQFNDDNTFNVFVDLHNVGASWARGGIYVTGYDPNMITLDKMDIMPPGGFGGNCFLDVGSNGAAASETGGSFWETVGFMAGCNGVGGGYRYDDENWGVNVQNLGRAFTGVQNLVSDNDKDYTNEWWSNIGFAYDNNNPVTGTSSTMFHMDLGPNFDYDNLDHGRGMLILLAGLSFEKFGGIEYVLAPNNYDYPGGEQTTVSFNGRINAWPKGLDRVKDLTFLTTNCYVYSTYADPTVCIDPDPYGMGEKVCSPQKITYNGGNGAPVAITQIEQENTRHVIYFDITIKNIGNGQIFDMMQMEACNPNAPFRLSTRSFNKVYFTDARIGEQHLQCTPPRGQGVFLTDGRAGQKIRCKYFINNAVSRSAYTTPLIIEIGYGYSQSISRHSSIKRVI